MVDHCLKYCAYVKLLDGSFIEIGGKHPSIDSDIWYDDETPAPEVTFEVFKAYNMRSNAPRPLSMAGEHNPGNPIDWFCKQVKYYQDKTNGQLVGLASRRYRHELSQGEVPLTQEDYDAIEKELQELRAKYEKRLERYWKRYSSKVYARGYWANR